MFTETRDPEIIDTLKTPETSENVASRIYMIFEMTITAGNFSSF